MNEINSSIWSLTLFFMFLLYSQIHTQPNLLYIEFYMRMWLKSMTFIRRPQRLDWNALMTTKISVSTSMTQKKIFSCFCSFARDPFLNVYTTWMNYAQCAQYGTMQYMHAQSYLLLLYKGRIAHPYMEFFFFIVLYGLCKYVDACSYSKCMCAWAEEHIELINWWRMRPKRYSFLIVVIATHIQMYTCASARFYVCVCECAKRWYKISKLCKSSDVGIMLSVALWTHEHITLQSLVQWHTMVW